VGGKGKRLGAAKKFPGNQRVTDGFVPVWFLWIILGVDGSTALRRVRKPAQGPEK
jgi:hypothetical protein